LVAPPNFKAILGTNSVIETPNSIKGWEELVIFRVLTNVLQNKLSFNSMIINKTFPNSLTKFGLMPSGVVKTTSFLLIQIDKRVMPWSKD